MSQIKLKSATEVMKARMKKHRADLKTCGITYNQWVKKMSEVFPQYASSEAAIHLFNVWYGRVADVEITEETERFIMLVETETI